MEGNLTGNPTSEKVQRLLCTTLLLYEYTVCLSFQGTRLVVLRLLCTVPLQYNVFSFKAFGSQLDWESRPRKCLCVQ